ncbi:spermatogenesis-associated protein 1 [Bombina bombina]|uniref:spermatogenesis-associated protein 1 n=1 Tax=Bombina bombina TaxID=8345 RepID=UPI00235A7BD1|nr:spermatogenesis-associated protein 1 [Bombina bombina]
MDSNQDLTPMNQTRPSTSGLIELHVYYVPDNLWNSKLNKVSTDVINKFISIGFIRVSPEMRLRTLRERLGEFLGDDVVIDKFVFLKCVGRSLAVVKAKQEQEIKLKAFAPPYAFQPELYLLPGADYEGSNFGSSVSPDEHHYNTDYIGFDGSSPRVLNVPEKSQLLENEKYQSLHTERVQPLQNEIIQPLHTEMGQPLHNLQNLSLQTEQSTQLYLERDQPLHYGNEQLLPTEINQPLNTAKKTVIYSQEEKTVDIYMTSKDQEVTQIVNMMQNQTQGQRRKDLLSPRGKEPLLQVNQQNLTRYRKGTKEEIQGILGIPESLGGRETEHPSRKRNDDPFTKNAENPETGKVNNQFGDNSLRQLPEPVQYLPPPPPPPVPVFPVISSPASKTQTHGETVLEQLKNLKEERIQMEKSREELIKKAKSLLEQCKLKRYQARDSWKKKYYERKKATSVLEETINKLRTDLEAYYQKLLTQLAARDSKKRTKYPPLASNSKNAAIMQITKKQQEIDQLKRKVENAKIKLLIEIKMRKQALSDLNVLKAELAQKKAQSTLPRIPVFSI